MCSEALTMSCCRCACYIAYRWWHQKSSESLKTNSHLRCTSQCTANGRLFLRDSDFFPCLKTLVGTIWPRPVCNRSAVAYMLLLYSVCVVFRYADVPFPLVDLVYYSRPTMSAIQRRALFWDSDHTEYPRRHAAKVSTQRIPRSIPNCVQPIWSMLTSCNIQKTNPSYIYFVIRESLYCAVDAYTHVIGYLFDCFLRVRSLSRF